MKTYVLEIGEREYRAEVKEMTTEYARVEVNGETYHVKLKQLDHETGMGSPAASVQPVTAPAAVSSFVPVSKAPAPASTMSAGAVNAPLPGLILEVTVSEGQSVKAGQDILVMEAMKMENQIQASHDGTVTKVYVNKGDSVAEGDLLVNIARSAISTL